MPRLPAELAPRYLRRWAWRRRLRTTAEPIEPVPPRTRTRTSDVSPVEARPLRERRRQSRRPFAPFGHCAAMQPTQISLNRKRSRENFFL